jgi:ribosome-associated toxin RatA of RatAB toxin-antitoxin module
MPLDPDGRDGLPSPPVKRLAAGALLGAALLGAAHAATDVSVRAERRESAVHVVARATLEAPLELVWKTLTDYDHLAEFIPGIATSRLLGYRGPAAIVEQHGAARFLFLSFPIDVTVESVEHPRSRIEVHVLKGNLKRLDGGYRIERLPSGALVLHWSGLIEPGVPLPPLIGELALRAQVERQFAGMVREIERRESARKQGAREKR